MKFALDLVLAVAVSTAAIDDECSLECQDVHKPVCGCNNETYYNECHLRLKSCLTDDEVVKVSDGESAITAPPSLNALDNIDDECGVACWISDEPVIDEDGVEYQNECFMNAAKCESKRNKNKNKNKHKNKNKNNDNNQSENVDDFILHA